MSQGRFARGDRLPAALVLGAVLLLFNTAYLAAFATASVFYYANVAFHVIAGFAVFVAALLWIVRRGQQLSPAGRGAALLLGAGGILGAVLTFTGATSRFHGLLVAHIAITSAGAVLAVGIAAVAVLRRQGRIPALVMVYAAMVCCAIAGPVTIALRATGSDASPGRVVNPPAPTRMEGEGAGPSSPFFPSSANTNVNGTIPANFFMTSETCGRCHKDIYEQWNSSVHHFSSFNNQWYRKSIEYMQDVVGTQPSKWCAGCHDHAVFFNGRFDRPIKEQIDTPEAQAGLACTSCHSIIARAQHDGAGGLRRSNIRRCTISRRARTRCCRRLHDTLLYPRSASRTATRSSSRSTASRRRSSARRATRCISTCR